MRFFLFLFCIIITMKSYSEFQKSDHFNGSEFFMPNKKFDKNFLDLLKWQIYGDSKPWPKSIEVPKINFTPYQGSATRISFLTHASFLIETPYCRIITDPHFSEYASPVQFAGPKRVRPPALSLEQLPPIDIVLISHNHYDHMDSHSVAELEKRFSPKFIVPLANRRHLESFGAKQVLELDWWQSIEALPNCKVSAVEVQHWSRRSLLDTNKSLWSGFVIESNKKKILFAGDTGYGPHFKKIYERYSAMDISLLPIGAYEPRWFMKDHHMNPEDAVLAHQDLHSKMSLGMHFGTFKLTDEAIDTPEKDLNQALVKYNIPNAQFEAAKYGKSYEIF